MSDQLLGLLKLLLLGALYLFFARVLWAVWSEVKVPAVVNRVPSPASDGNLRAEVSRRHRITDVLVLKPDTMKGQHIEFDGRPIVLGRDGDCTVVLDHDDHASRHHARISVRDGRVVIEDLGSTNGTIVNGARIDREHHLEPGDRFQIGGFVAEVRR